jgi:hypothetical protein
MSEETPISMHELEKLLDAEHRLRVAAEASARKWKADVVALENEMSKAEKLRERLERYRFKLRKARQRRNIYGVICIVLVLAVVFFLVERYQKAKELDTLRKEFKEKGAKKRVRPGIIDQAYMEYDAERQGGSGAGTVTDDGTDEGTSEGTAEGE